METEKKQSLSQLLSNRESPKKQIINPWLKVGECALLFAPTGLGKEQPLTAKVLTPHGWKTMGEMKVGTEVCTPDGSVAVVDGVFPQGVKPAYEITFYDGSKTQAGLNHLWKTYTTDDATVIKTTKELLAEVGNKDLRIPLTKPVKLYKKPLSISPFLLGCIMARGALTQKRVTITTSDAKVIARCKAENTLFDFKEVVTGKSKRLCVSKECKYELKKYELDGLHSREKFIPKQYLYSSVKDRQDLLAGIIDTSCSDRIGTSSERLANDLLELARGLGYSARKQKREAYYINKGHKYMCKPSYRVSIYSSGDAGYVKRKLVKEKLNYKQIKTIKRIEDCEQQCISINHPKHLYVTDDYTVTHNTHVAVSMATAIASGQTFLGKQTNQCKVHYFDGEMGKEPLTKRLLSHLGSNTVVSDIENYLNITTFDMYENRMPNLSTTKGQVEYMKLMGDAEVVIFDNELSLAYPESNRDDDIVIWNSIREFYEFLKTKGKTIIHVHHAGKAGAQLGTSRREFGMDIIINLRRTDLKDAKDGEFLELHFDKGRHLVGEEKESLLVEIKQLENDFLELRYQTRERALKDKVVELDNMSLSKTDIANLLSIKRGYVSLILKEEAWTPSVYGETNDDDETPQSIINDEFFI